MKITPREKGETRWTRLAFLVLVNFNARSRFARSTVPKKNGDYSQSTYKYKAREKMRNGVVAGKRKRKRASTAIPLPSIQPFYFCVHTFSMLGPDFLGAWNRLILHLLMISDCALIL